MKSLTPSLAVDAVIVNNNSIVCVKRKNIPFKGMFALPGGFMDIGETTEQAIIRESLEETGLHIEIVKLLGVYSEPLRDPRGHVVSICYLATSKDIPIPGSDACEIKLFSLAKIPQLAFDHNRIIDEARRDICGILSKM